MWMVGRPYVCGAFTMPNAQPTSLGFWDTDGNPGVDVAGRRETGSFSLLR